LCVCRYVGRKQCDLNEPNRIAVIAKDYPNLVPQLGLTLWNADPLPI
jgi:hypothetical protein